MPEEIERNRYEFPSNILTAQPTKIDGKVVMVVTLESGDVWHWDGTNPPYEVQAVHAEVCEGKSQADVQ